MPSSITIPVQLRKKIKKIAALLDTSQSEVISRAIDEYEKKYLPSETFTDPKIMVLVNEASERIYSKYPERKKRAKIISKSGDSLDSLTPAIWGRDVNE